MNGKKRGLIGFLLFCVLLVHAEKSYKYRVQLTDKAETAYSIDKILKIFCRHVRLCEEYVRDWLLIQRTCRYVLLIFCVWRSKEVNFFRQASGTIWC